MLLLITCHVEATEKVDVLMMLDCLVHHYCLFWLHVGNPGLAILGWLAVLLRMSAHEAVTLRWECNFSKGQLPHEQRLS